MNGIAEAINLLALVLTMLGFFTTISLPAQAHGQITIVAFTDVGGPGFDGPAPAYASGAAHNPALVLQLGDFDHRNPCASGIATTCRSRARVMYSAVRTCISGTGSLISGCDWEDHLTPFPLFHVRDDHDGCLPDADRLSCLQWPTMTAEFKVAYPDTYPNSAATYRERFQGPVHILGLDLRSQRDPKTWPEPKTMLGPAQRAWLLARIVASPSPWVVILSSVPLNPTAKCKVAVTVCDAWKGYPAERAWLVALLRSRPGVVVLSGDLHTGGGIDDGRNSGVPELNVPHTNLPTGDSGVLGTWSHGITSGNLGGGYGVLTATATTLTLDARAADGTLRHTLTLTR